MLVIQFCRRAGSRRLMACRAARESRWGENLARKRRRGTERPGQNFKGPGGCRKEAPQARACCLCAQAFADSYRAQRFRSASFLFISVAVLRLWQEWHRL